MQNNATAFQGVLFNAKDCFSGHTPFFIFSKHPVKLMTRQNIINTNTAYISNNVKLLSIIKYVFFIMRITLCSMSKIDLREKIILQVYVMIYIALYKTNRNYCMPKPLILVTFYIYIFYDLRKIGQYLLNIIITINKNITYD